MNEISFELVKEKVDKIDFLIAELVKAKEELVAFWRVPRSERKEELPSSSASIGERVHVTKIAYDVNNNETVDRYVGTIVACSPSGLFFDVKSSRTGEVTKVPSKDVRKIQHVPQQVQRF